MSEGNNIYSLFDIKVFSVHGFNDPNAYKEYCEAQDNQSKACIK